MDVVPDYNPDIVGDIHKCHFRTILLTRLFRMAVLEHIERSDKSMQEIHRTLKPGGYCLVKLFLYYYHQKKDIMPIIGGLLPMPSRCFLRNFLQWKYTISRSIQAKLYLTPLGKRSFYRNRQTCWIKFLKPKTTKQAVYRLYCQIILKIKQ